VLPNEYGDLYDVEVLRIDSSLIESPTVVQVKAYTLNPVPLSSEYTFWISKQMFGLDVATFNDLIFFKLDAAGDPVI
jgi:hypothetical protein